MRRHSHSDTPEDDSVTPIDINLLSGDRKRLFETIERINRAWIDSMRQMRQVEGEFSIRLFASKSSSAAMGICNQWMAKRLEILGAEQQIFAQSWAELVALLAKSRAEGGARRPSA